MKSIVFAYPGNEAIASLICKQTNYELGISEWSKFPDGESRFCLQSEVTNKRVILVCSLDRPDEKLSRLYFFSQLLKSYGAAKIVLLAPYLSYMRQDKIFRPGEGITASYCAQLISGIADELITVDPHLHRIPQLSMVFSIPCIDLKAAASISTYIKTSISNPVLIGPDAESVQWVSEVAQGVGCAYTVLEKIRTGDREVQVKMKDEDLLSGKTVVLVDDIISTGRTLIETLQRLQQLGIAGAHCVAVHAVFADQSYQQLQKAGALSIVTCDTISHPSNAISLSPVYAQALTTNS